MTYLKTDIDASELVVILHGLEKVYPDFAEWYRRRVVPGVSDGSRMIFAEVAHDGIAGVAIAKRSREELKLCTLWRDPFRGDGDTASRLMRSAMAWLGTDRPVFTVPFDRIQRLRPVLNEFGMGAGMAVGQLYRPGVEEILFNAECMR